MKLLPETKIFTPNSLVNFSMKEIQEIHHKRLNKEPYNLTSTQIKILEKLLEMPHLDQETIQAKIHRRSPIYSELNQLFALCLIDKLLPQRFTYTITENGKDALKLHYYEKESKKIAKANLKLIFDTVKQHTKIYNETEETDDTLYFYLKNKQCYIANNGGEFNFGIYNITDTLSSFPFSFMDNYKFTKDDANAIIEAVISTLSQMIDLFYELNDPLEKATRHLQNTFTRKTYNSIRNT